MKKILAFAGSNSSTSINVQLVKHASTHIKHSAVEFIDLRDYDTPIYSADLEKAGIPKSITALIEKLKAADGYIIGTPEHNGSLTAFLKNILDWMSRVEREFFGHKPVVLLSTSGGKGGGSSSLQELTNKMKYFAGEVVGKFSLGSFYESFDQEKSVIVNSVDHEHVVNLMDQLDTKISN